MPTASWKRQLPAAEMPSKLRHDAPDLLRPTAGCVSMGHADVEMVHVLENIEVDRGARRLQCFDHRRPVSHAAVEIVPGPTNNSIDVQVRQLLFFGGALKSLAFHAASVC